MDVIRVRSSQYLEGGGYTQSERPASSNPPLANPAASTQSVHFHYHQHIQPKQEQEERYNVELGRAIDAVGKLENQLTNNPEAIHLLHATFSHWNDPANCSKNIWLPPKDIAKLTPDQCGTIEELLMSLGMVKGHDPTGKMSFF
jgi:hypothetical protein